MSMPKHIEQAEADLLKEYDVSSIDEVLEHQKRVLEGKMPS